jgi:very-short-patch-repair endonuclease|nr:MAG TPA: endonuclease-like protein [Caudoviricetes sp.]
MIDKEQAIPVRWCSKNKERYVKLGYNFTKMGDVVYIKVKHLSSGTTAKVTVVCDYCNQEYQTTFHTYTKGHKHILKDACKKCANLKSMEAFKVLHGVTNPLQVPEINKKQKETCLMKYGVEFALQNPDLLKKKDHTCEIRYGNKVPLLIDKFKKKKERTCMEKYGVDHSTKHPSVRRKMEETCFLRYGCKHPMKLDVFKEKLKQSFNDRYGVDYCLQVPEFAKRARVQIMKTLTQNGNVPTSSQQIEVYNLVKNMYGEHHVILNKSLPPFFLDIELQYKDVKIDIEYDGTYWHQDVQKDRRRDEVVKSYGYKVLRIRGSHSIPTKEQIQTSIEYLVNENHCFSIIKLDI